jgi:hypothetical protein
MKRLRSIATQYFKELQKAFSHSKKINFGLLLLIIVVCIGLASHLFNGDILFHTDLARDFLVLDDIIQTKKITLIGPRSGGISGVFHGPLWYYINIVPFLITNGNPVLMGWFWWFLGVLATLTFFITVQKLTQKMTVSLLTTLCFALIIIPGSANAVNNYLADLFSFLVFVCWWMWYKKPSFITAALGWFGLGLLVQFQMAFAIPMAIAWFPFFVIKVLKEKLWQQLLTVLLFLPPLSSFVLFDLRHDWLQVRSVLQYVQSSTPETTLTERLLPRFFSALVDGLDVFRLPKMLSSGFLLLMAFLGWRTRNTEVRSILGLCGVWYVGWWLVTLIFSGTIWQYYFSPFFGIFFVCVAMVAARSKVAHGLLALGAFLLLFQSQHALFYKPGRFNSSSWKLLTRIAADALSEPNKGYFLYSQDQFTYSLKYTFLWQEKLHQEVPAFAFKKKPKTVVVKAVDDPTNPHMSAEIWQQQRININQEPDSVTSYPFGYRLEEYSLDEKAMMVPIDPNLILDLHFR